jgi:hypothetical protein
VSQAFVDSKITPGNIENIRSAGRAIGAGISVKDFADEISGSKAFPAHSEGWEGTHPDESVFHAGGYGYLLWTANPANENSMGAANVTYSFVVEIPESSVEAKPNR